MLRPMILFVCGLAMAGCQKENPCVARAELLCQMGEALTKQQGLDPKESIARCEESKKLAAEADENKQKQCSEDINNYRKAYEVPASAATPASTTTKP